MAVNSVMHQWHLTIPRRLVKYYLHYKLI